ncbi:MAG: hypothetical protein Q9198_005790 [Flavoplaca austrocitrina]
MGSRLLSPTIFSALAFALYGLYQWLLPKPLSGIAYNAEATKSLFGDAPEMLRSFLVSKDFGAWCAHQVEKMRSPICQVFIYPFSKPWILVADFRESQDILMRRKDFDRSTWVSDAMGALGDFHARMKTNKDWKRNRRWMQDLMTPSFLNTFVGPAVHSKGLELVKLFEIKMDLAKGRPFNVRTDFEYASVDCMTDFAFGQNLPHTTIGPQIEFTLQMDPSKVPDGKPDEPVVFSEAPLDHSLVPFHDAPHLVEKTLATVSPRLSLWWWKKHSWFQKVFSHKNQVLRAQIEKAVKDYRAGEVKTAAEHMVMREAAYAQKHDREPDFETHILIDEIFGVIVAGHHTTGGAMGWIAKYLTGHPAIQSKLRSALYTSLPEAVSEKRFPTFDELRRARIPYLDAVIEEMLRLTAVTVTREALYDTQILGQHIPKGSTVFLVSNGPGFLSPSLPVDDAKRSPTSTAAKDRSWDETKDLRLYDPERWLVHNGDSVEFDGASGPQLGFGAGTRGCWGKRMAYIEMRHILSLVVWSFELLEIPEELGGYAAEEGIARRPQRCFVKLGKLDVRQL